MTSIADMPALSHARWQVQTLQSQHGNFGALWGWTHQRAQLRFQAEGLRSPPKEAQRLRDEQATISVERELAKRDGKITGRERAEEQHDLNVLSKDIHRKKYNKRRVYQ
jgi:hypothetical protein